MTLLEAVKTGKRMKRDGWQPNQTLEIAGDGGCYFLIESQVAYRFSRADMIADDWLVEHKPIVVEGRWMIANNIWAVMQELDSVRTEIVNRRCRVTVEFLDHDDRT